jgi:molybdopterin-guanine dinucleotide biosynthesis protein
MPIIVIGGQSRKVGKTGVVVGLISALRGLHWTALKVSQHGHAIEVKEETDRSSGSDTSRYLVAGADHSWWIGTEEGQLAEAMPRIREILASAKYAIIESNSILQFLRPDLYITVLDPAAADFKASAQQFLDSADAILLHARTNSEAPVSKQVSLKSSTSGPVFEFHPPQYVTPEIAEFVRNRLFPL